VVEATDMKPARILIEATSEGLMTGSEGNAGADRVVYLRLDLQPDPELDPEATERLARQLRAELTELEVESVIQEGAVAPDGAKGADPVTVGAVIVALSASGGVFTALIDLLRGWLDRQSRRHRISVVIDGDTIELERPSTDQQQALLDAFVQRHSSQQPR
jgi:hypothetical protein